MIKFDQLTDNSEKLDSMVLRYEKKNNNLPENVEYVDIGEGIAAVVPKEPAVIKVSAKVDKKIKEKIEGDISRIEEYLYNSQTSMKVKEVQIGGKLVPIDKMIIAPFKGLKFGESSIIPKNFSEDDFFDSVVCIGKRKFNVRFYRSPYDGLGVKRYQGNINKDIVIVFDFHEDHGMEARITFNFNRVERIDDILRLGSYIKEIHTLKVNDYELGKSIPNLDDKIKDTIEFWKKVKYIGKTLSKRFKYKPEVTEEDIYYANNIYSSLYNNKYFKSLKNEITLNFKENPNNAESLDINLNQMLCCMGITEREVCLLGKNIKLFSEIIFVNYEFRKIEKNDGKIKFSIDLVKTEESFVLERYFKTEKERDKFHKKLTKDNSILNKVIGSFS